MADLGRPVPLGAKVLDFGSGDGAMVDAFQAAGYDAYGCDIELAEETDRQRLIETPYRLPFADAAFDFVASAQVLEHVQDHDVAFREMHRVLKPGGTSLHMFPPRWRLVEPHTYVPLATLTAARPWLLLWATLGVRNEFQRDVRPRVAAARNRDFLRSATNYVPRRKLEGTARRYFGEVEFVERLLLKHS